MKKILVFLVSLGAFAQSYTLTSPAAVVPAGSLVTLNLSLVSAGGPAGLEFGITGLPASTTVTANIPGKTLQCAFPAGVTPICLIYTSPVTAANNVGIPDGLVATISYPQPAAPVTIAIPSMSISSASVAEAAITIAAPAGITVGVQSRCDLNGDGKVDATDIGLAITSALSGTGGVMTIIDVQRIIIAVLGGSCLR